MKILKRSFILVFCVLVLPGLTTIIMNLAPTDLAVSTAFASEPVEKLQIESVKTPLFTGTDSDSVKANTIKAHTLAYIHAWAAVNALEQGTDRTNAHFIRWFGTYNATTHAALLKHYKRIANELTTQTITYAFGDTACRPNWYAFTVRFPDTKALGERTISLCGQYKSAELQGRDSKFGTITHELSHAVDNSVDKCLGHNVYNFDPAVALASDHPDLAVKHADTYEYFAETLFPFEGKWKFGSDTKMTIGQVTPPLTGSGTFQFKAPVTLDDGKPGWAKAKVINMTVSDTEGFQVMMEFISSTDHVLNTHTGTLVSWDKILWDNGGHWNRE